MSFPLYILLYIYFAFLLIWLILSLVAVYHMFKFGFKNFTTFFTTFVFLSVSFLILAVAFNYLIGIDWNLQVSIFNDPFDFGPGI